MQSHAKKTWGFLDFPYAWYSIRSQDQCEKWGWANSVWHAYKARSRFPGTHIHQELEKVLPWDGHFRGSVVSLVALTVTFGTNMASEAISEHAPKFKTFSWGSMSHTLHVCACTYLAINTWSYQSKIAASSCAKWYMRNCVHICSTQQFLSYIRMYDELLAISSHHFH